MDLSTLLFCLLGGAALGSSIGVLVSRHPLHAALYLIGTMLSLAGLYAILDSPFLGVLQVLVYAGAIMMLLVFVIMVLNRAKDHDRRLPDWLSVGAVLVPMALCMLLLGVVASRPSLRVQIDPSYAVRTYGSATSAAIPDQLAVSATPAARGEIAPIAARLFAVEGGRGYWLLFQLIGVLLLIAIVGAVLLAKRRLDTPEPARAEDDHDHH